MRMELTPKQQWFVGEYLIDLNATQAAIRAGYSARTAEWFEKYIFEGKAPSFELASYFQKFAAWMKHVYKSVKRFLEINPNAGRLDDEVRGIFDRMLATTEDIKLAEQGRSMMPLFANIEQSGMSVEGYAAYQGRHVDATNTAIEDLQAKGLRDMKWLGNAKGKALRRLQREVKALRAEAMIEARREVMRRPVYRAWQFLTGKLTEDDRIGNPQAAKSDPDVRPGDQLANPEAFGAGQLDLNALEEMYGNSLLREVHVQNSSLTKADAEKALASLRDKELVNLETKIAAKINTQQARKLISNAAMEKSEKNGFARSQHYAAAAHIEALWKHARLLEEGADRDGDINLKSIKRFVAPIVLDKEVRVARILAKESVEHGHRVYALELQEIETLRGMLDTLYRPQEEDGRRTPARSVGESIVRWLSDINEDFQRGAYLTGTLQSRGMTSRTAGLHPDIVADLILGENDEPLFSSGDQMVRELAVAPTPEEAMRSHFPKSGYKSGYRERS